MNPLSHHDQAVTQRELMRMSITTGPVMVNTVTRWRAGVRSIMQDELIVEEPCEIRVGGQSLAVIMRTPGADEDLTRGFLVTEGIVGGLEDVVSIEQDDDEANVIAVRLVPNHPFDMDRLRRNLYASSSCGICGKASIKAVRVLARPLPATPRVVSRGLDWLAGSPARSTATLPTHRRPACRGAL